MKEKSYVMVKPEFANSKEVIAEIKRRLEANGITILEASYINMMFQERKDTITNTSVEVMKMQKVSIKNLKIISQVTKLTA